MPAISRHFRLSYNLIILQVRAYTISIANTKNVNTNGITSVNQGQLVAIVNSRMAVEIKNNIQYKPLFLFFISMWENFSQK